MFLRGVLLRATWEGVGRGPTLGVLRGDSGPSPDYRRTLGLFHLPFSLCMCVSHPKIVEQWNTCLNKYCNSLKINDLHRRHSVPFAVQSAFRVPENGVEHVGTRRKTLSQSS